MLLGENVQMCDDILIKILEYVDVGLIFEQRGFFHFT